MVLLVGIALVAQTTIGSYGTVSSAKAAELNILNVGMLQGVATLSPFLAYEDSEYVVFNLIYDRLMSYDEDLNVMPLIATSWEVESWEDADDPGTPTIDEGADRLWRYHIVEGATWHDGEPVTAYDVNYTINLNLQPQLWSYTPYINWRWADHATAVDANTVEVYLKIPNVHIDALSIPIIPMHIWKYYGPAEIQYSVTNDNPIGSGPFKFVELVPDQRVVLEKNPNYYKGEVKYDQVVFLFYGNDQVMAEDLKKGNIDVAKFSPLTYESLIDEPDVGTAAAKKYYQSTLGFNCFEESNGNRLLLDENLRRAMHMAIDKQYIIDTVWRGYADMGYALPAPVIPYYHWEPTASEELAYNATRANALLNASGYDKWNSNGIRLVNTTTNPYATIDTPLSINFQIRNDAAEDIAAAPYVVEFWERIGVEATIQLMEESALETLIYYTCGHDAYIWYWSGDYDPTYILGVMTTDQFWGWNDPFWSNQTYDQMYLDQLSLTDAERQTAVFEMQKIWYESSGMICLSYPYGLYAWSTKNFDNWGDPVAHPGRTIDHYFGAAPLFMELEPKDGGDLDTSSGMLMYIGIGIAAVAVVAVVAFFLMKRSKDGGIAGPPKEEKKTGLE